MESSIPSFLALRILVAWTASIVLCNCVIPLYAQQLPEQVWGQIALNSNYEKVQSQGPSYTDELSTLPDDYFYVSPIFHLGLSTPSSHILRVWSMLALEQRFSSGDSPMLSNPLTEDESEYSQNIIEQRMALALASELRLALSVRTGFAIEGTWSRLHWAQYELEPTHSLLMTPWAAIDWTEQHYSYLSTTYMRRIIQADPAESSKMNIDPAGDANFRISHIYTANDNLRLAAELYRETLRYGDFWKDHVASGSSIAMDWNFYSPLSTFINLGWVHRQYILPWKRIGTCSSKATKHASNPYSTEPRDCHRWEDDLSIAFALNWDIFADFRLSGIVNVIKTHGSEAEFATLKESYLGLLSWQTQSSILSDSLRRFLPWVYRTQAY